MNKFAAANLDKAYEAYTCAGRDLATLRLELVGRLVRLSSGGWYEVQNVKAPAVPSDTACALIVSAYAGDPADFRTLNVGLNADIRLVPETVTARTPERLADAAGLAALVR